MATSSQLLADALTSTTDPKATIDAWQRDHRLTIAHAEPAVQVRFGFKPASSVRDRLAPGGARSLRRWFVCGGREDKHRCTLSLSFSRTAWPAV